MHLKQLIKSFNHLLRVYFIYVYLIDYSIIAFLLHYISQLPLATDITIRSFKSLFFATILFKLIVIFQHAHKPTPPSLMIDFASDFSQTSKIKLFLYDFLILFTQLLVMCLIKQKQLDDEEFEDRDSENNNNEEEDENSSNIAEATDSSFSEDVERPTENDNSPNTSQRVQRLNSLQIRRLQHFLRNYRRFQTEPSLHIQNTSQGIEEMNSEYLSQTRLRTENHIHHHPTDSLLTSTEGIPPSPTTAHLTRASFDNQVSPSQYSASQSEDQESSERQALLCDDNSIPQPSSLRDDRIIYSEGEHLHQQRQQEEEDFLNDDPLRFNIIQFDFSSVLKIILNEELPRLSRTNSANLDHDSDTDDDDDDRSLENNDINSRPTNSRRLPV